MTKICGLGHQRVLILTVNYCYLHHLQLLRDQAEPVRCLGPQYGGRADRAACCGTVTARGEPTAEGGMTPLTQTHGSAREQMTQCQEIRKNKLFIRHLQQ